MLLSCVHCTAKGASLQCAVDGAPGSLQCAVNGMPNKCQASHMALHTGTTGDIPTLCSGHFIRLLAARNAPSNMMHTPQDCLMLVISANLNQCFLSIVNMLAVCMPHAYVMERLQGLMPYL